jgi:putative transposase
MPLRGRSNLIDWNYFFVTTTVVDFIHVFSDDKPCDLLIKNIQHYQKRYKFNILGYVIMPSHFHWIVETNTKYGTISDIMRDIKKYSAWDILEYLTKTNSKYLDSFSRAAIGYKDQSRKFWMKRFDDVAIRNERMFWEKLHYIHKNPVKSGLIERSEDYKYSSARNYICNDHSIIEVDISLAGIEIK